MSDLYHSQWLLKRGYLVFLITSIGQLEHNSCISIEEKSRVRVVYSKKLSAYLSDFK